MSDSARSRDRVDLRLDPDLRRQITQLAERSDRTLSAEIRVALREYIQRHTDPAAWIAQHAAGDEHIQQPAEP